MSRWDMYEPTHPERTQDGALNMAAIAEEMTALRQDMELLRQELHALQRERSRERDSAHG